MPNRQKIHYLFYVQFLHCDNDFLRSKFIPRKVLAAIHTLQVDAFQIGVSKYMTHTHQMVDPMSMELHIKYFVFDWKLEHKVMPVTVHL